MLKKAEQFETEIIERLAQTRFLLPSKVVSYCNTPVSGKKFSVRTSCYNRSISGNNLFRDDRVGAAMLNVDRADFCPRNPYFDNPEPIGYNATISAPHMVSNTSVYVCI